MGPPPKGTPEYEEYLENKAEKGRVKRAEKKKEETKEQDAVLQFALETLDNNSLFLGCCLKSPQGPPKRFPKRLPKGFFQGFPDRAQRIL